MYIGKFYPIINHELTDRQVEEIRRAGYEIVVIPQEIKELWRQVDIPVSKHITPIIEYIKENVDSNDAVLVQGHFGATYLVVNEVKRLGAKAIYAHSVRDNKRETSLSQEKREKLSVFEHIGFVEYGV